MDVCVYYQMLTTPLGEMLVTSDGESLTGLSFGDHQRTENVSANWRRGGVPLLAQAKKQLEAYFAGELIDFDLRLAAHGTVFQHRVWDALCRIPFGTTVSYGALARNIGRPTAARAVGAANRRNPIGIIVPCHRVIGADGGLTGFASGLDCKKWLLQHEAHVLERTGVINS